MYFTVQDVINDDIIILIYQHMNAIQGNNLSQTSKRYHTLYQSEYLWKYYYQLQYSKIINIPATNPRTAYQTCYAVERLIVWSDIDISIDDYLKKTKLNLNRNQITSIPPEIGQLVN